ncbi:T9SS type A sorting domain-containing protein [Fulvivirgaceae bacterium BMA10]|uniref:T9SS type A sorting domain-containing protein n=1 Tax=Splendidivirga corallicola TaxID=3051826 RepID=A0ABT8KQY9_9BACT|nr:T9SS type A sorting domain-containing protein [Fulvivirgaceae bacterium BMA10]
MLFSTSLRAQQLAFPGAEGFARFVSGGRGGTVIYVTNLNDSGTGSLRAALEASGTRTVLFKVSGTIVLESPIRIRSGNLTIAGESSPNGITTRKSPVFIAASNVIVRYMRFRLGNEANKSGYDALSISGNDKDIDGIIIDHCSISWAKDENLSVVGTVSTINPPPYYGVSDVTIQNCIVSEGLATHAFGGFIKYQVTNISVLKNLFAHNVQRNPNVNGATGELINNVIYNWGGRGVTLDDVSQLNVIGNYAKSGVNSKKNQGYMMISGQGGTPVSKAIYVDGNYHSDYRTNPDTGNEWDIFAGNASESQYRKTQPHSFNQGTSILTAFEAYDQVLAEAGASLFRDAVDDRIVNDAKNKTGTNNITSPASVGGWPSIAMGTPYQDTDGDGMEDSWEVDHNLDPNDAADGKLDQDGDGYTNLEEYLHCRINADCGNVVTPIPPTISNIADQTIDENTSTGPVDFTIGDQDTPLDQLTLTASSSNNTLISSAEISFSGSGADRQVTATPKTDQTGTADITITVSDGTFQVQSTFTLTVNGTGTGNTAPTISAISDQTIDENTSTGAIDFTVGDQETSADQLTLTASSNNNTLISSADISFSGSGADREVTATPKTDQFGTADITITVSDGDLQAQSTFTLTVNETGTGNTTPTISAISDQTIDENTSTGAIDFTIGDQETSADQLTLTASSNNNTLISSADISFSGSGADREVTATPKTDQFGTADITITVSDGDLQAQSTFTLTVNEVGPSNTSPTISAISDQTIDENTSTGAIDFTIGDQETSTDQLTVTASSSNNTLIASADISLSGSGTDREVTATPKTDQFGTADITITVSDGELQAQSTFTLTVNEIPNTAPTISIISNQTIDKNASTDPVSFTVGDLETPLDQLTITASSNNTSLISSAEISFSGTGADRQLTATPKADQTGVADITVTVSDGELQVQNTFTLIVNDTDGTNTAPTISALSNISVNENEVLGPVDFTISDQETSVDDLVITVSSDDQGLVVNQNIVVNGTGSQRTLTVTPNQDKFGETRITLIVSDGASQAATSFYFTINSKPFIAAIRDQTTDEDVALGPLELTLTDKDSNIATLSLTGTSSNESVVPVNNIVFEKTATTNSIRITPLPNQHGSSQISITVSDGIGEYVEDFTLIVRSVNDVPMISAIEDLTIPVNEPANIDFTIGDEETSAEELTVSVQSYNSTLVPSSNMLVQGDGEDWSIQLTPVADKHGSAEIVITVSDGESWVEEAFTLTVGSVTGIDDKALSKNTKIYPNPGRDRVFIKIENRERGPIQYQLYDVVGKLYISGSLNKEQTTLEYPVSIADLPKGNYIVHILQNQNRTVKKLIKF